ncbi:MAG: hypothetical protein HY290_10135 [Planctomycetia bacterium]|nr:hypothetical protein [Planctomycetia bacterium]
MGDKHAESAWAIGAKIAVVIPAVYLASFAVCLGLDWRLLSATTESWLETIYSPFLWVGTQIRKHPGLSVIALSVIVAAVCVRLAIQFLRRREERAQLAGRPPRARLWIPVSVRLFVAVLALAGLGRAFGFGLHAYRQQAAIREVDRLGGKTLSVNRAPSWLKKWLSEGELRVFDEIQGVHFQDRRNPPIDDAGLAGLTKRLGRLKSVTYVTLDASRLTGAGIQCLAEIGNVERVYLSQIGARPTAPGFDFYRPAELSVDLYKDRFSDADLARIQSFQKLKYLWIGPSDVTDAGLAHLENIVGLEGLFIHDSKVTGQGLLALSRLPRLEMLRYSGTRVGDSGLESLADLTRLAHLDLSGTSISDAGLSKLIGLHALQDLCLRDTGVTERGLAELIELPRLRSITALRSQVTDSGVAALQHLRHGLRIQK